MMKKNSLVVLSSLFILTMGVPTRAQSPSQPTEKVPDRKNDVEAAKVLVGKASWYSEESPGINLRTANNEIFDDSEMTCAMWGVPFNQRIKVTNRANGKSIIVRVNDRGPHHRFVRRGRVVDLTKSAFSKLSGLKKGLIDVSIEFL